MPTMLPEQNLQPGKVVEEIPEDVAVVVSAKEVQEHRLIRISIVFAVQNKVTTSISAGRLRKKKRP